MKVWVLVILTFIAGCAPKLPMYEPMAPEQAMQVLADRAAKLGDISATCRVTLRDAAGETVTLDGALVARGDTHLRLRGWKFNQAVVDLTMNDDGVFVWVAEREGGSTRPTQSMSGNRLTEALRLLTGRLFAQASPKGAARSGAWLDLTYAARESDVLSRIDVRTLTVVEYRILDRAGQARQRLWLDRYKLIGDVPWPMRVRAEGEQGRITIELDDVDLHADLPEGAFDPPRRAVRQ